MDAGDRAAQSNDSSIERAADRDRQHGTPEPATRHRAYAATSSTRAFRIDEIKALEPWLASTVTALIDSSIELLNGYSGQDRLESTIADGPSDSTATAADQDGG